MPALRALALPLLTALLPAQGQVHVVDPTNPNAFAGIQAAIAAAAPGDVILVRPRPANPQLQWSTLYAAITIDKSLTIAADTGADVRCWSATVQNLQPQDQVVLRGITFERPTLLMNFGAPTLAVRDCSGLLLVEECAFRPATPVAVGVGPTFAAVEISGPPNGPGGAVTLVRCTLQGVGGYANNFGRGQQLPALGLRAERTACSLWDCTVNGGKGPGPLLSPVIAAGPGAEALAFGDGTLFASGTTFTGGAGGDAQAPCGPGGAGGDGVVLTLPATAVEMLACQRRAGAGGNGCPAGPPGQALRAGPGTLVDLPGASAAVRASSPHRAGETMTLLHTGAPGGFCFGFLDDRQFYGSTTSIALAGTRHLLGYGGGAVFYGLWLGPAGSATLRVPLPAPPGVQGQGYLFQTISTTPNGELGNGAPSALLLLAPGL